jgi:hypothetical protein
MPTEFFNDGTHRCIRFPDLSGEGEVQANQFLVIVLAQGLYQVPK